jgi:putative pyruvate formate lyase activating enzyme
MAENVCSCSYLSDKDWENRIERIDEAARSCALCSRLCGINRFENRKGYCGAPGELVISSIFPHHGEEPPISGTRGSGTIFFSHCSLRCCFCQNYQISQENEGSVYSINDLAKKMIHLQELGCHNINLVTATHFLPWIVRALRIAAADGLRIPIVYNCSGYESPSVISMLDDIIDIYLPDMKYGDMEAARKYSHAEDYPQVNQKAIKEMFRQTGPLRVDSDGIAWRGLCIRHLVLPGNLRSSENVLSFLKTSFDPVDITISLMAQYRPLYKASKFQEIDTTLSYDEYERIKEQFIEAGFEGFYQQIEKIDTKFIINFKERKDERLTGE